jgi:hypothetical protein
LKAERIEVGADANVVLMALNALRQLQYVSGDDFRFRWYFDLPCRTEFVELDLTPWCHESMPVIHFSKSLEDFGF